MSIQFNIMYPVCKNFKTKILLYNSLRTYDIFIVILINLLSVLITFYFLAI
jgi:hypothetical protein